MPSFFYYCLQHLGADGEFGEAEEEVFGTHILKFHGGLGIWTTTSKGYHLAATKTGMLDLTAHDKEAGRGLHGADERLGGSRGGMEGREGRT